MVGCSSHQANKIGKGHCWLLGRWVVGGVEIYPNKAKGNRLLKLLVQRWCYVINLSCLDYLFRLFDIVTFFFRTPLLPGKKWFLLFSCWLEPCNLVVEGWRCSTTIKSFVLVLSSPSPASCLLAWRSVQEHNQLFHLTWISVDYVQIIDMATKSKIILARRSL